MTMTAEELLLGGEARHVLELDAGVLSPAGNGNGNGNGNGQQGRNGNGNGQQPRNGNGYGGRAPQPGQHRAANGHAARPPQQDRLHDDDREERMPRNVDPLQTNLPGRRDMTGVKRVVAGGQPDPTRTSIDSMGAGNGRNRGRGNPTRNYSR